MYNHGPLHDQNQVEFGVLGLKKLPKRLTSEHVLSHEAQASRLFMCPVLIVFEQKDYSSTLPRDKSYFYQLKCHL